ncbi:YbhB/YbcL family Raf kinase inhibitor-like protein [Brevundimonas subvibrioides]|nr:YbhB/YbcL family Raf kinase inhibitor-like protein [Brevundimonas subvibrioides]
MTFTLTSNDFKDGDTLPDAQVQSKGDTSPHLAWSGAPEGTKSFAITVFDPDAPTGSGFWHWTVANIPVDVTEIPAGGPLPQGAVEGRTDYGEPGFGGAAPPPGHGPHRYVFTVFAVDTDRLEVTPEDSGAKYGFNLHFHTLARASITATYENRG